MNGAGGAGGATLLGATAFGVIPRLRRAAEQAVRAVREPA